MNDAEARGDAAREAGFTLIEMLVALALLALVTVLLVTALQATGIIIRDARRLAAEDDVQIVRDHLHRLLASAVRKRGDGSRVPFSGGQDHLVVVKASDQETERGAELQVEIATARDPGGSRLDLIENRAVPTASALPPDPEILLEGIAGLRMRYFGLPAQSTQPGWSLAWTRHDRLPALVEVTVDFPASDPRRWRPLVLELGGGG